MNANLATKPDPKRPYKAYASAAVTGLASFVAAWVADVPPFESKEIAAAAVGSITLAAASFGITFSVRNPKI